MNQSDRDCIIGCFCFFCIIGAVVQFFVEIYRIGKYDENFYYTNGYWLRFSLSFHIASFVIVGLCIIMGLIFKEKKLMKIVWFFAIVGYLFCLCYDVLLCIVCFTNITADKYVKKMEENIPNDMHGLDAGIMMVRKNSTELLSTGKPDVASEGNNILLAAFIFILPTFGLISFISPILYYLKMDRYQHF